MGILCPLNFKLHFTLYDFGTFPLYRKYHQIITIAKYKCCTVTDFLKPNFYLSTIWALWFYDAKLTAQCMGIFLVLLLSSQDAKIHLVYFFKSFRNNIIKYGRFLQCLEIETRSTLIFKTLDLDMFS